MVNHNFKVRLSATRVSAVSAICNDTGIFKKKIEFRFRTFYNITCA
jgi:hypothetical protein